MQLSNVLSQKKVGQFFSRFFSRNPQYLFTVGDILSEVWNNPMVKVGTMRFIGGIIGSIVNDL